MKNLFKHILFGAAIFAGMGLFVGCDTMTDDEIEKLINDKINAADATPSVALAGTTWTRYSEGTEGYTEDFLKFTETTITVGYKTYKKADDSLLDEWEQTGGYYVQGNIIIPIWEDDDTSSIVYDKQKNCLYYYGMAYYRVEE